MPVVNLACPVCEKEGKTEEVPLEVAPLSHNYHCRNGHTFRDTSELMDYRPHGLLNPPAPPPKPEGPPKVSLTLTIPEKLKTALDSKFGDRLNLNATSILVALLDPRAFIVSGDDAKRISNWVGEAVKSGSQIAGVVSYLKTETRELQEQLELAKHRSSASGNGIELKVGELHLMKLLERAKARGISLTDVAREIVEMGLDNGWV